MAEDKSKQPIIIKRVVKGGHASHGGAWKIAYADFVTAMMAFFLLLWLLNSVTQEQLEGISNYFAPVSVSATTSGSGGILGGKTATEEGVAQSTTSRDSVTVDLPPPQAGTGGEDQAGEEKSAPTDAEAAAEMLKKKEEEQFQEAKEQLEKAIEGVPALKQMKDSLVIDNTPEGMRIQLIDKEGLAMFPSGGAEMYLHTRRLLEQVSKVIVNMPQNLSISGHTDAKKFVSDSGYGNWELSADRANAARRELAHFKIPEQRFARVVGKAATEPYLPDDPEHASNRRLSIILLRGTGKDNPANNASLETKKKKASEALPGLNAIKERQLEGEKSGAQPAPKPAPPGATPDPIEEAKKKSLPLPAKPGLQIKPIKPSAGEALPGLDAIRKRQLEEERKARPAPMQTR